MIMQANPYRFTNFNLVKLKMFFVRSYKIFGSVQKLFRMVIDPCIRER